MIPQVRKAPEKSTKHPFDSVNVLSQITVGHQLVCKRLRKSPNLTRLHSVKVTHRELLNKHIPKFIFQVIALVLAASSTPLKSFRILVS